jgi:hypothetical protein
MFHTATIPHRNWMLTAYIYQRQKERRAINILIQKEYRLKDFFMAYYIATHIQIYFESIFGFHTLYTEHSLIIFIFF